MCNQTCYIFQNKIKITKKIYRNGFVETIAHITFYKATPLVRLKTEIDGELVEIK